jgi:hypothetical protein
MATEGRGSARIVLVGRRPERRPAAAGGPQRPRAGARPGGWTVRRLTNGASLGGIATVLGGLVFQRNFQLFGDNNPLLPMGFGLFVVGMVVFTLCLIGLAAAAVRSLAATRGWGVAALAGLAASAPLLLLGVAGVVSLAFPALFVLMVTGGFVLALKR